MKILIVDDDRDLTDLLSFVLQRAAFRVIAANESGMALQLIEDEHPALVLLDARIGPANGFDLLREIRRSHAFPVIMLTAMAREEDKILAFQLGADDYVTKPFSHRELIARIHARLRSPSVGPALGEPRPAELHLGSLTVNAHDYSATRDGRALKLTATEFRVLQCLVAQAGTVMPTAAILKHIWGYDDPGVRDSLRVTVYRLRRKIEDDPTNPRFLQTVPGVGFVLKSDGQTAPPPVLSAPDPGSNDPSVERPEEPVPVAGPKLRPRRTLRGRVSKLATRGPARALPSPLERRLRH
jgi:two-component system, OmpR family, response regulator VicR